MTEGMGGRDKCGGKVSFLNYCSGWTVAVMDVLQVRDVDPLVPISGHNGEWLGVMGGAWGAFLRLGDVVRASEVEEMMRCELDREARAFRHVRMLKQSTAGAFTCGCVGFGAGADADVGVGVLTPTHPTIYQITYPTHHTHKHRNTHTTMCIDQTPSPPIAPKPSDTTHCRPSLSLPNTQSTPLFSNSPPSSRTTWATWTRGCPTGRREISPRNELFSHVSRTSATTALEGSLVERN